MNKPIAIIAGEPNSISSEIIFKSWKIKSKYNHKPFFVIGNFDLLKKQNEKLKFNIKIKKINKDFKISDLKGNNLPVYNIEYIQKSAFEKISNKSNNYILECFKTAIKLIKKKEIIGLINCPVSKEHLFHNTQQGITEFLSKKFNLKGNEVMLIFNKKMSVSPLTTHIPLNQVTKKISKSIILKKVKIINNFYKKYLNKNPKIGILGLNPHNFPILKNAKNQNIINSSIANLKKNKINISGPISPDTSFMFLNKYKYDVLVGMYHDQVLTPFKTLYNFNAINITLGLPCIRISPDHGVAGNITGKNLADAKSLIESIKFFNKIN